MPRGDAHVGVTELRRDVAELDSCGEELARIGVAQILERAMRKAGRRDIRELTTEDVT